MSIWAVGRNYARHAKELGNAVPTEPVIFLKSSACLVKGEEIVLERKREVHYELELAFLLSEEAKLLAFALALDLTDRKLQNQLKEKGLPWTLAKSFKNSCPISPFVALPAHLGADFSISLEINGSIRQKGQLADMLFQPQELASYIKERLPILDGDILLTGTPSGVGILKEGDELLASAFIKEEVLETFRWKVSFDS